MEFKTCTTTGEAGMAISTIIMVDYSELRITVGG